MNEIRIVNNKKNHPPLKRNANKISTTLYTWYTFFPFALFSQLKKFTNLYFIVIAILSIIPSISPLEPISTFAPVAFVILFSMSFDLYEDLIRALSDRKTNNTTISLIRNGTTITTKAKDVQIGDLLILEKDQRVAADSILLTFKGTTAYGYIDMSSLDGEKSLKPKTAILGRNIDKSDFLGDKVGFVELDYGKNSNDLGLFEGYCRFGRDGEEESVRLDVNNFLPRSAVLRNVPEAIALVVYVGRETKIMLNTQRRVLKESRVEKKMNLYIFIVIIILGLLLLFLSGYSLIVKRFFFDYDFFLLKEEESSVRHFTVKFFSYFVIMNTVLPISLIVTLQLVKVTQKGGFDLDDRFRCSETKKRCLVKTVNIHEELGQIEYLLSDKTGTLTQNKMITQFFQIDEVSLETTGEMLKRSEAPRFNPFTLYSSDNSVSKKIKKRSQMEFLFFIIVNCCHDCFSVMGDETEGEGDYEKLKAGIAFEGPSPDEVALLSASRDYCRFLHKGSDASLSIIHSSPVDGPEEDIEIKKHFTFSFDSDRKLMSMIVEYKGDIFLLVKGADSSVLDRLSIDPSSSFMAEMNKYVYKGLRTMFFAVRLLSKNELNTFLFDLKELESKEKKEEIRKLKMSIEKDLTLIGGSAIEDKLQPGLRMALGRFRDADIKTWVITGDKGETAQNIALSSGLFRKDIPTTELTPVDLDRLDELTVVNDISPFDKNNLLISGSLLELVTDDNKEKFTDFIMQYESIVFYRTNPNQKVEIVRLLKSRGKAVLAVGDGANDVNMIQEADVGVGIMGEEGKQAENASDFSIPRFEFLLPLIFNFGRISYFRNTQLILYFYYKNFIFTIPQFLFGFVCFTSQQIFYNSFYIMSYNLFFTALHVPARAVTDIDIDDNADYYSPGYLLESFIYFYGQREKLFNPKKFIMWLLAGSIESIIVFYFLYVAFRDATYFFNKEASYEMISMLYFSFTIFFGLTKITYLTRSFTIITFAGYIITFLFFPIYVLVSDDSEKFGYRKAFSKTYLIFSFLANLIFLIFGTFILTMTFQTARILFFPSVKDKIREGEKSNLSEVIQRTRLKDWREDELKDNWFNRVFH